MSKTVVKESNMIDDKAIMAAAKEYTCYTFIQEQKAFAKGANWAIQEYLKNLWHPIKEKPQKERVFLYQTADNAFGIRVIVDAGDWEFITKYQRATRWLYIDDLFPKKGE